jgi:hypothetical protein
MVSFEVVFREGAGVAGEAVVITGDIVAVVSGAVTGAGAWVQPALIRSRTRRNPGRKRGRIFSVMLQ